MRYLRLHAVPGRRGRRRPVEEPRREDGPARALRLQQHLGNRAMGPLLRGVTGVQAMARLGSRVDFPHDPLEREADRVAAWAVRSAPAVTPGTSTILPPPLRHHFESRLGRKLDGVRLHHGPGAHAAARALDAHAFTVGRDITFDRGEYAPHTRRGLRLLAHELVHVAQQSNRGAASEAGPVRGSAAPGAVQRNGRETSGEVESSVRTRDFEDAQVRVRTRFTIPLLPDLSLGPMTLLDNLSIRMGVAGQTLPLDPAEPLFTEEYQIAVALLRMKWEEGLGGGHTLGGGLGLTGSLTASGSSGSYSLDPNTRLRADLLRYGSPSVGPGRFSAGLRLDANLGASGGDLSANLGASARAGYTLSLSDQLSMGLEVEGEFQWDESNFTELRGTPRFTGTFSVKLMF